jgi:signal transduction histidine kinase
MKRSPLRTYEGQIKTFLFRLVLFLAAAILLDVHLLVVARDAIQEEVGGRLALQADLVRADLERDQMLRGLRGEAGTVPYIPPTLLDRLARLKGMIGIEILTTEGRVLSSSRAERVGRTDAFLAGGGEADRRRLQAGGSLVAPLDRVPRSRYATLAAYRPIQDRSRATLAVLKVESEVPVLAAVHFNLTLIAVIQAAGLVLLVVLVILFARWLLQPYRRLLRAAGQAPGQMSGLAPAGQADEPDYLVAAFQGVLDKLRAQEGELQRLRQDRSSAGRDALLPGDHLVGGMTSAVLAFDRDGRLTVLNAAAERILGLQRGAATGRRYGDLLGGTERLVDLIGRSLKTGESFSREVIPRADGAGKTTHLGAMIAPIRSRPDDAGSAAPVEGVLCLLTDLTEIKVLRDRVGLKENLASLGEMSAGIAHEFRNSLATLQGLARLISKGAGAAGPSEATRENAEAILREVGVIGKVVDDFLRYARPVNLDLSEIDLGRLVEDLARDFRDNPKTAGIAIGVEGTFPRILADPTLVRQALHNLLLNAAESFPEGREGPAGSAGGTPRACRVILRGEPDHGGARITVEDNGAGIPEADLPRLFTPFFTTKERGSGLGLALVQKAAVLHDGHVEVQSRPGAGTRFTLALPPRPGTSGSPPAL